MKRKMNRLLLCLLLGMWSTLAFSQAKKTITGQVKDDSGNPIVGATIKVAGTKTAVATDATGSFNLQATSNDRLTITSVGFEKKELQIGNQSEVTITLGIVKSSLEEVVVTALGIKRSPRSLGYTVTQVGGAEVTRSNTSNVGEALAGKVASLNITTPNGVEGGSTRIVIDGNNSITGNNQPLIIVDGIPMNNDLSSGAQSTSNPQDWGSPLNLLNAPDIESMSVLKGPAAAALYGGRGANGVIIITTKKGVERKGLGVDYTFGYKSVEPNRYLKMQNQYGAGGMVSLDAPAYQKDANGNPVLTDGWNQLFVDPVTGSGPFGVNSWDQVSWPGSGSSWGPKMDGTMIKWWNGEQLPDNPQPDNIKLLYRNGMQATHTVSLSGGNEWGNLRVSYTRLDNTAVLPNTDYNQNTVNLGSSVKISKKVTLQLNASYFVNVYHNAPQLGNNDASSWQKRLLYNVGRNYKGLDVQNYKNPDGTQNQLTGFPWIGNGGYVVWNIKENNEWQTRRKLLGSAQLNYQATNFLDIMFRAGIDANNNENLLKNPPTDLTGITNGKYGHGLGRDNTSDYVWMATLHKENIKGSAINAKLSVGGEAYQRNLYSISGSNNGWSLPNLYDFATYNGQPTATSETTLQNKLNSLYGLLDLSYKNLLFLDVTGRNDWSSTLPKDEWSYFFPSVSASFIFSDALKIDPSILSFGKLRLAWAQAAVPPDPYQVNFTYATSPFAGQLGTMLPSALPAVHYKPQINTTQDVGLTLGFLKNHLNLDLRYYHGRTKNQILSSPLPISSGVSSVIISQGELENSGYEMTVNAVIVDKPSFRWDVSLNGSHNSNKLLSLAPGATKVDLGSVWGDGGAHGPDISVRVGEQFGTIYGYDYTYDPKTGLPLMIQSPFGKSEMNGTLYQATSNLVPIGNANPKFIGGISNTFTFKNALSIGILVDTKLGGDIWSGTYATMMSQGQAPETLKERNGGGLPYTSPDGTTSNTGVLLPGVFPDGTVNTNVVHYYYKYMRYGVWSSSGIGGSDWLDKTSIFKDNYVKMREISINYSLPAKFVQRSKVFQGATVSLVGRDLFYIYSSLPDNINPEGVNGVGNAQGIEFASLPSFRSLGFQVRLSF
ncbi:MAG: SusC/RagA family TonB-linked outer membrane protein [Ginsengibacter sp.]